MCELLDAPGIATRVSIGRSGVAVESAVIRSKEAIRRRYMSLSTATPLGWYIILIDLTQEGKDGRHEETKRHPHSPLYRSFYSD